ncbi:hypothetical protein Aperf_G00000123750 [Anoplocephala perfoliata]
MLANLTSGLLLFDNPVAHAPPMTRRLTHLYLVFVNLALLFYPSDLCADWAMGSIPLITSFSDWRNACTLFAFIGLLVAALRCASPRTQSRQALTLSFGLALPALPILPASNLFFYVGFVVAERVFYVPSAGFCLVLGLGFQMLLQRCAPMRKGALFSKRQAYVILAILCSGFALKTFYRNYDWKDEYSLFTSALKVNQQNAKLWNNVGHALESQLKFDEALLYFQQAPDDMGARINVGRTLVQLNRLNEVEEAYYQALDFFPKPKKGMVYHTRVSPKDLTIFINRANILAENDSRLDEADALLRFQEAENMHRTALKYRYTSAALHYNLGVVLLETNRTEEAYKSFHQALHIDSHHEQTLFALASSYSETADAELRKKAVAYFEELTPRNYEPIRVNFALAILYTDFGEFEKAARLYRAVLESHPDHITSYMLLGGIELSVVKNATFAIKLFEEAVKLAPNNLQARHNYCGAFIEGTADLEKEEECLQGATLLADPDNPNDEFVFRHLALIRAKRRAES